MSLDSGAAARLPRITIFTPCRNGERFIAGAIESVRRQGYPDLEHVVLDACSTDGTLALLSRYPRLTVISEPDVGAHDAMNKGVARETGEIIGFLNVDDFYPDGALIEVGRIFAEDADVDVVVGGSVVFEDDSSGGRKILFVRTHDEADGLWLSELTFGVPGFNGCFFRRRVFEQGRTFRTDYPFTGDRTFLMGLALAGRKSRLLDRPTIWYRRHPGSRTVNREMPHLMEISREYVRMALELADESRDRPAVNRVFMAWHAFEATKLTARSLLAGRLAEAFHTFVALNRRNPLWLVRLVEAFSHRRVVGRLTLSPKASHAIAPRAGR
jgi:glycosyltransferase involved in cell wall biosynthesis